MPRYRVTRVKYYSAEIDATDMVTASKEAEELPGSAWKLEADEVNPAATTRVGSAVEERS